MKRRTCAGKPDGSPCGAPAKQDSNYCRHHQTPPARSDGDLPELTGLLRRLSEEYTTAVLQSPEVREEVMRQAGDGVGPEAWLARALEQALPELPAGSASAKMAATLLKSLLKRLQEHPTEPVPRSLPQSTFQEARAAAQAYSDGPSGHRWANGDGEVSLIHVIEGEPLQVKLTAGPYLEWLGLPSSCDSLRQELRAAGIPAVLMLYVTLGMVLRSERGRVAAGIDDLIGAIGWKPRTTEQRKEMRRRVWRWLLMFDATWVIGLRGGQKWKDRMTGEELRLATNSPLIRVVGTRPAAQLAFDGSEPPLEVSWVAGDWPEQWRGNRQVLSDFGDVMRIAKIPAGQPSGAWAQAVGLALQQRWRERAQGARIGYAGEDNRLTLQFQKPVTRRDLLGLFRCEPYVEDILSGEHPYRARQYWEGAIRLLKEQGVIGYYKELRALKETRQGWAAAWLDQPLDIRPQQLEDRKAIAEVSRAAANARKKTKKKPARPAGIPG